MSVPGLAARVAAAELLAGVLERGQTLAEQGEQAQGPLSRLAPPERARAQRLAASVLRHLGRIDALLAQYLGKRPRRAAMDALRLAAVELNLDNVPAHAAVDGAVRLVRQHPNDTHLAGLVNAVARRMAEAGSASWDATPAAGLPHWLADPIRAEYGAEVLAAIERAHALDALPLDLTLKAPDEAGRWSVALGAEVLPTGSLRMAAWGQVSALPGFAEGAWWVQDAAAALPVRLFGPVRGRRVLDLCAAPGGKTLQLAASGAQVTALDLSEARIGRLRANLRRTGLEAEIVCADALDWQAEAPFDAVLLDAPCTASGTIRRHPELPHLHRERSLASLLELQARLLARAWHWVAPGGTLVYCTCSLLPAEGPEQVARFREAHLDAVQIAADAERLGIAPDWVDAAGGLRLRPDHWLKIGGMDGFYAALLQKPAIAA